MSYPSPYDFAGAGGDSYSTTPTTPLEADLPQWNTYEHHILQQQQEQQQQQLLSHPPTPQTYPTIQLDERAPTTTSTSPHPRTLPAPHVVPSQMQIETATAASPQLLGRHGHGREGSISPTAPVPSSGLVIKSSSRSVRNRDAKPYDRPQSELGTGSKTPTVSLREGSRKQSHRTTSGGSNRPATAQHQKGTPSPIPSTHVHDMQESDKSYVVRADVYVDPESKVFTALLELPGVRREEVRVTLSSCVHNGVKQVTVSGRTRDPFSASQGGQGLGKIVRERKYGRFIRTFAVSSDTKLEDVDVTMNDGLLSLRIRNRPDIVDTQVQEVPISYRFSAAARVTSIHGLERLLYSAVSVHYV